MMFIKNLFPVPVFMEKNGGREGRRKCHTDRA